LKMFLMDFEFSLRDSRFAPKRATYAARKSVLLFVKHEPLHTHSSGQPLLL